MEVLSQAVDGCHRRVKSGDVCPSNAAEGGRRRVVQGGLDGCYYSAVDRGRCYSRMGVQMGLKVVISGGDNRTPPPLHTSIFAFIDIPVLSSTAPR